jgi:SNF2 family DNA or RNA helicase
MIPRTTCTIKGKKDKAWANVCITSYSSIQSRPVLVDLLSRRWDLLIFDEAHALKNPNALTTKICYGADYTATKGLASRADRVWLLSGTIIPTGPHEMWTHARALFPEACEGLERYNAWVDKFCYWRTTDYGTKRILSAINIEEFVRRWRPYIKRRLVKDVLPDLPPLRFSNFVVAPDRVPKMSEEAQEAHTVLKAALGSISSNPTESEIAAVIAAQQLHIASLLKWTGIAKAPAVAEAIKTDIENGLKKVVIFARHSEVFNILQKELPGLLVINGKTPERDRQRYIDSFQNNMSEGGPPAIACHMDIASTALTLTAAADVAFAETFWVPKDIIQAAKRCHRIGQSRPVLAKIYSLKGSLDETVSGILVHRFNQVSRLESRFTN